MWRGLVVPGGVLLVLDPCRARSTFNGYRCVVPFPDRQLVRALQRFSPPGAFCQPATRPRAATVLVTWYLFPTGNSLVLCNGSRPPVPFPNVELIAGRRVARDLQRARLPGRGDATRCGSRPADRWTVHTHREYIGRTWHPATCSMNEDSAFTTHRVRNCTRRTMVIWKNLAHGCVVRHSRSAGVRESRTLIDRV